MIHNYHHKKLLQKNKYFQEVFKTPGSFRDFVFKHLAIFEGTPFEVSVEHGKLIDLLYKTFIAVYANRVILDNYEWFINQLEVLFNEKWMDLILKYNALSNIKSVDYDKWGNRKSVSERENYLNDSTTQEGGVAGEGQYKGEISNQQEYDKTESTSFSEKLNFLNAMKGGLSLFLKTWVKNFDSLFTKIGVYKDEVLTEY